MLKRLKVLVLLAVAAFATTAALSAASASAVNTVLCSENIYPCPSGKVQPAGSGFAFLTKEMAVLSETHPGGGEYTEVYTQFRCTSGSAGFASTQETAGAAEVLPAISELFLHAGGCKTFGNQESSCVSETSINSPPSSIFSSGEKSAIVFVGNLVENLTIGVTCKTIFGTYKCNYVATDRVPLIFNTATNQVYSEGIHVKNTGSSLCLDNSSTELRYKGEFVAPWTGRVSRL